MSESWRDQQWRIQGNWEPRMFLKRRGEGAFRDVDAYWAETHSEAAIERMKAMGINVAHIHFHKGYGLQHERESIAEARDWAARLHAHGIRVGVYIGCTFFYEVFRHPDYARMVVQNSAQGWGGAQYFRKAWCYNSPHAQEYIRGVIGVAINEVKADLLHLDSAFSLPHDQLCQCEYCLAGFRQFVRAEIPEIIAAAGYAEPEHLLPPPGNRDYLTTVREMTEPGDIAWALFHAQAGLRALTALAGYARSLSSDVAILYNGANLAGISTFSRPHLEMEALHAVDVTCVEDFPENPVGVTADGMPVSRFRAYKAAARARTRVCYYTTIQGQDNRLMLAEAAAFGYRGLGFVEAVMHDEHVMREGQDLAFLRYVAENESLFTEREPWHHVAVLRHHESMLLNPFPSGLSAYVVEQILFERHIPFAIIGNRDLVAETLSREFDVIVLPDCKCLGDDELRRLEAFVMHGGRLLSIGNSGQSTPLNQWRPLWGLAGIFGRAASPSWHVAPYFGGPAAASAVAKCVATSTGAVLDVTYGAGRAMHLPPLEFQLPDKAPLSRFCGYDWYYHPYWRPTRNTAAFLQALDSLLADDWRIRTDLPRTVGLECYRVADGYRLHLVNYRHPEAVPPAELRIRDERLRAKRPSMLWQTQEGERVVTFTPVDDGTLAVQLPEFALLATLSIRME